MSTNSIKTIRELRDAPREIDMLLQGLLPRVGVGVLAAESGCGKTALAMDLVGHIGAGLDHWQGFAVQRAPVLYLLAEGQAGLPQRFFAMCEHLKLDADALNEWIYFRLHPTDLSHSETLDQLTADINEKSLPAPGLIVLDTHSSHAPAGFEENNASHAKELADGFRAVAREWNCLVLVVHHFGWGGTRMRGSSDLHGSADVVLSLKKEGEVVRVLSVDKARDFQAPEPIRFALRPKYGGICVESIRASDSLLTPSMRQLLGILIEISEGKPVGSKEWERKGGYSSSQFHVIRSELLKARYVERTRAGMYAATAEGAEILRDETNRTPTGVRQDSGIAPIGAESDSDRRSSTTPVMSRSFRTGHRSGPENGTGVLPESGNGVRQESYRSPNGKRDAGPGLLSDEGWDPVDQWEPPHA